MRGSTSWALVAAVPLVFGGAIKHNTANQFAADLPTIQTAPTAAEVAESIEGVKISNCVSKFLSRKAQLRPRNVLTTHQCLNIASVLPGKVYGSASNATGYAAQSSSYYSNQEREVKPACFVLPQSSQDVSTIIKTLSVPNLQSTVSVQGSSAEEESYEPKRKGWGGRGFAAGWGPKNWGGKSGSAGPKGSRATGTASKNGNKALPNQSDDGTCKFAIRSGG
jgi:hypothetical protein